MDIILNQVAIWLPTGAKGINVRKSPLGTRYREYDGVVYKSADKSMVRYAKDYVVSKVKFSLFVRTFCEDIKQVEAALDAFAQKITKEYVLQATANSTIDQFQYTPFLLNLDGVSVEEEN